MEGTEKYALVTGASSGIGWKISEILARKGYSILAASNQLQQLTDLKKRLEESYPVNVVTIKIDLFPEDSATQIFKYSKRYNLEVEVLVNNAGILVFNEVVRTDFFLTKNILNLHMITPALLCRLFGESMIRQGKGFILNVSSISAVMPYPGISLYGPSKTFLRYFTRALRTEMKRYKINVTCLIPGATATSLYNPEKINIQLAMKLGIMKKPETVARAGTNALFKNKPECIPGILNKLTILILPLIPNSIICFIYKKTDLVKKMN